MVLGFLPLLINNLSFGIREFQIELGHNYRTLGILAIRSPLYKIRMELFWILCRNCQPRIKYTGDLLGRWPEGCQWQSGITEVIGYFSCHCDQSPDQSNLRQEEFILTHSVMNCII